MGPVGARCRLGLGGLRRRWWRVQEARSRLADAAGGFRELRMPFWRSRGEAELASLA